MKHNCVLPNLKHLRCFFSQFFNHPSAKKQQVRLISLFLIGFFIFFGKPCFSQGLPCLGVSTECSGSNDPLVWASFKCIDANGETFSNLITAGLLTNNVAQNVVIKGVIKDDIATSQGGFTFGAGSTIIFADQSSGIEVNGGCKLTLERVTVRGCSTIWKSIYAKENSTLVCMNSCAISDGKEAIFVDKEAYVSITDCFFNNNGTAITLNGVDLTGVRRPIFFTPNGGIWGNQITGGAMLAPLSPYHSFRGIVVSSVTQIQIGNVAQNQNVISNMKGHGFPPDLTQASAGVYVNNSSVNIANSRFIGNGYSTVPFLKDAAITTENKGSTTFTGLGMDGQTVFEDCHVGMYFSNSSGNISFSKFLNNKYDVVNDGPPVQPAINNLFINTCNFDSFKENAVYLKSFGAISLTTFEVKDSRFNDNNPTSANRAYLLVEPGMLTNASKYTISGNKFYCRFRNGSFGATAITVINLAKGMAENNEFYNEAMDALGDSFIGGKMEACTGFNWRFNSFFGAGSSVGLQTNPLFDPEVGIQSFNSTNCIYNCNTTHNFQVGLMFLENCDGSSLFQNTFNNSVHHGIHLANEELVPILTVIGVQDRKFNVWTASGADFNTPGAYNPSNPQYGSNIARSRFWIHHNNMNAFWWADPILLDGVDDDPNDPLWFRYKPTQSIPASFCGTPPYPIPPGGEPSTEIDLAIINGTFLPWMGLEADTWETSFYLYQRIAEGLTAAPLGSLEHNWFLAKYNSNIGKFQRLHKGFLSLFEEQPTTTTTQLLSDWNAISTSTVYEQNLKTVLGIFIQVYINEVSAYNTQQQADLAAIAGQCRATGGLGVVMARLALGLPSTGPGDCSSLQLQSGGNDRSSKKSQQANAFEIFPNPASDRLNIRTAAFIKEATVLLRNAQGQVARTWVISGTGETYPLEGLSSGIYYLEILEEGRTVERKKIVLAR